MTENLSTTKTVEILAAEIRALTGSVLSGILEIGRRFTEAKQLLPHGTFGDWVRGETGYSMSTANNFMRLYSEYGADQGSLFGASANSQTFGNLSYSKALALLEVPAEEREDFAREVGAEELSVRELKEAIRERDEKLTKAENRAEGYRVKLEIEQNFRTEDAKLAKAKEIEAKKKLDAMRLQSLTIEKQLEQKNAELFELQCQLEELRSAPKEVAVETVIDEEAVKKAAQEAREKAEKDLKAKIAKAEKERDKALADREKAEKAKAKAEQALEAEKLGRETEESAAKKALEISNAQLADLQKKLALADSPEKVSFKFWFEQGQACVNNMLDCVGKLRNAGKGEDADKLANALRVFLEEALLYSGKVGE